MDAEGGRVFPRERRSRKLAVVVAVQNLLVAACLVVMLYVYWDVQGRVSPQAAGDDVHIRVEAAPDISDNGTLQFCHVHSRFMMSLEGTGDKIYLQCTGPYLLYMDVCYKNLSVEDSTAVLQVRGGEAPVSSFTLQASHEACRGLHSTINLRAKQGVSVGLLLTGNFKIMNMTVGLTYLLRGSVISDENGPCEKEMEGRADSGLV